MGKKKELKEMFPNWASPEAIIERIREEYSGDISENDIYRNDSGDVVITLDFEHILIFRDDERPGLYIVGRNRIFDQSNTYSDANSGLKEFLGGGL